MSPRIKRLAIGGIAAGVLAGVGVMGYNRVYAGPMAEAAADLNKWERASDAYERDLDEAPLVGRRLSQVAGTTLGKTEEEVAHRFRTLLGETARMAGLTAITITEGRTAPELNPAASRFRLQGFTQASRRTSDFFAMNGEMRGTGDLEAVARVLELCDSQPWIHRVSSFSITPVNDERREFEVKVSVATLILPDMGPPADAEFAVTPLEPGAEAAWASIVSKNVFRVPDQPAAPDPPPVAITPTPVDPVPAGPAPQPYHEWVLSGVMEGAVVSVVMVHPGQGLSLSLEVGESVLDARLVRASGETAVFAIGEVEFEVCLQQSLADRRAVGGDVDGSGGM